MHTFDGTAEGDRGIMFLFPREDTLESSDSIAEAAEVVAQNRRDVDCPRPKDSEEGCGLRVETIRGVTQTIVEAFCELQDEDGRCRNLGRLCTREMGEDIASVAVALSQPPIVAPRSE